MSFLLFNSHDFFFSGENSYILFILSLLSIVFAISVITNKNPIVSTLFLIGLFVTIAIYLILIGVNFIGLSYILVYVGAVSILFIFILMLLNVRISELLSYTFNSLPLAYIIMISCLTIFTNSLFYIPELSDIIDEMINIIINQYLYIWHNMEYIYKDNTSYVYLIQYVSSYTWDGVLVGISHMTNIGSNIYTKYPIWLILTSIVLLLAMVGSIVITTK